VQQPITHFFHASSFPLSLWSRYSPQHVLSNTVTSLLWNISHLECALVSTGRELRRHITLNFCVILIAIYLLHFPLLESIFRLLFNNTTTFRVVGWFPWRRYLRSVVEKNYNTNRFDVYKSLYLLWWCNCVVFLCSCSSLNNKVLVECPYKANRKVTVQSAVYQFFLISRQNTGRH
jgi:hypothetical protein